jgi:hypothetical protein
MLRVVYPELCRRAQQTSHDIASLLHSLLLRMSEGGEWIELLERLERLKRLERERSD